MRVQRVSQIQGGRVVGGRSGGGASSACGRGAVSLTGRKEGREIRTTHRCAREVRER